MESKRIHWDTHTHVSVNTDLQTYFSLTNTKRQTYYSVNTDLRPLTLFYKHKTANVSLSQTQNGKRISLSLSLSLSLKLCLSALPRSLWLLSTRLLQRLRMALSIFCVLTSEVLQRVRTKKRNRHRLDFQSFSRSLGGTVPINSAVVSKGIPMIL